MLRRGQKSLWELSQKPNLGSHFVCNKGTGKVTEMTRENNLLRYPLWVKRRIRSDSVNGEWKTPEKGKIKWKGIDSVNDYCGNNCECEDCWDPFTGQAEK